MFKQTFKYFFFNVIIFRGIISLNRILIYIYVLKIYLCQHTKSIFVRLKKKSIIYIKVILNKLLSIYNYLYKLCIKKIKK